MVDLHSLATRLTGENIKPTGPHYFCAILRHTQTPANCGQEEDFIWMKCKGTHTVEKIKNAYPGSERENIVFKLDDKFPAPTSTIQSLDSRGDRVVVFWAISRSQPTSQLQAMDRHPLQPVNSQPMGRPQPSYEMSKSRVKLEPVDDVPMSDNMTTKGVPDSNNEQDSYAEPGFLDFRREQARQLLRENTYTEVKEMLGGSIIRKNWNALTPGERSRYASTASSTSSFAPRQSSSTRLPTNNMRRTPQPMVKNEDSFASSARDDVLDKTFDNILKDAPESPQRITKAAERSRLQRLLNTASPEVLESEVQKGMALLRKLIGPLSQQKQHSEDAQQWLSQIEHLQKQSILTPTIIGVVGNTGAGKSSVINAMLDEERLVPTNCMRACTAVVTEMSWNSSEEENEKYRASIEFIKSEDWEKELKILFEELLDSGGTVSRDCSNPETDAGVAYAKIKAVYPLLTKDEMAKSTVEKLMDHAPIRAVLGTAKNISHKNPDTFYQRLQHYVDSKEKNGGKGEKGAKQTMEFWPLIKVVKIYTKSDALSTGAIIVDLPGVHDSNAARAAVAQNYIKQCTGLWIVAPINRAVDDKAAKNLMGESFKRQLKYDGTYSRVTFICSKTDDISITEATDGLGIQDDMAKLWAESDKLSTVKKELEQKVEDLKETKAVYTGVVEDIDDKLEIWEALQSQLEDGKTVYAPLNKSSKSKKRKRSESPPEQRKKRKSKNDSGGSDDDFESAASAAEESNAEMSGEEDADDDTQEPLAEEEIDDKISELKADKKKARKERLVVEDQIKDVTKELGDVKSKSDEIDAEMNSLCISGRNKYSKTAIQLDFAAGIKELDQENAIEEDEENFNPDEEIRDYEEVARSLPVFCVSSRGYQKLSGRLIRDNSVSGFKTIKETEIPQLQAHCKKLTEKGRASSCRRFLNSLSQLTNSLVMWASDGTGMNLTDEQKDEESQNLKKKLHGLEKGFEKCIENCIGDLKEALEDNIYDTFDSLISKAIDNAPVRHASWTAPVNRFDRSSGGFYYSTFKAIVRRNGLYTNAQGKHDFNEQLCEPIMRGLGNNWEKVFVRRLPIILASFTRHAKTLLTKFHSEIEKRGIGIAGMAMLKQQLGTYDTTFGEMIQNISQVVMEHQREASREFQPVIELEMQPSYDYCTQESGQGCYLRMKNQIGDHIDQNKSSMFKNSTDAVKDLLKFMCRVIENEMANGTDEVFIRIRRDYMQVVGGVKIPQGQTVPKAGRVVRAEICKLLRDHENVEQEHKHDSMKNEDEESAEGQLQNEAHEAADRIEFHVRSRNKCSKDDTSESITDSEEDEFEDENDENAEPDSNDEEDEEGEDDGEDSMFADQE